MTPVRPPAVAGRFYPADPDVLAGTVDDLLGLRGARAPDHDPVALVVPHAGYACSGPVAASAYRLVRLRRAPPRAVVVLGPAHFRDIGCVAVPRTPAWSTPLGDVPVDADLRDRLIDRGLARPSDSDHAGEHSVEVQIPFLQRVLAGGWSCLPVLARSVAPDLVADCLDATAGDGVMVVVSSDLSHYHDEATATALDRRTAAAVVDRDADAIGASDACGAEVVRGLLTWARRHGLGVNLLDIGTSADTCGGPDRVVGYAAFAVLPGG